MERYPEHRFAASQAQHYAWLEQDAPALYERMRERVREGRWEVVGGSLGRAGPQPAERRVARAPDRLRPARPPASASARAAASSGPRTRSATTASSRRSCAARGSTASSPRSCPGTSSPSRRTTRSCGRGSTARRCSCTCRPPTPTTPRSRSPSCARAPPASRTTTARPAACSCSATATAAAGRPRRCSRWRAARGDLQGVPRVQLAPTAEFFDRAREEPRPAERAPIEGELYFEYHRGTYTSQARTKRGNRAGERLLREAEAAAALALRLGRAAVPRGGAARAVADAAAQPVPRHPPGQLDPRGLRGRRARPRPRRRPRDRAARRRDRRAWRGRAEPDPVRARRGRRARRRAARGACAAYGFGAPGRGRRCAATGSRSPTSTSTATLRRARPARLARPRRPRGARGARQRLRALRRPPRRLRRLGGRALRRRHPPRATRRARARRRHRGARARRARLRAPDRRAQHAHQTVRLDAGARGSSSARRSTGASATRCCRSRSRWPCAPARDLRDAVRRRRAPDARQHAGRRRPVRGARAPLRRPLRARLRRRAAHARHARDVLPRLDAADLAAARADRPRPRGRPGRARDPPTRSCRTPAAGRTAASSPRRGRSRSRCSRRGRAAGRRRGHGRRWRRARAPRPAAFRAPTTPRSCSTRSSAPRTPTP